jgi:hypothetical protein
MKKGSIDKRNSFVRVGIRAVNLKGKDVSSNEVREDDAAWGALEPDPANRLRGAKPSSPVQLLGTLSTISSQYQAPEISEIPQ